MLETNEYLCNMYRQLSQESSHSDMFQISKDIGTGEIRRMKSKQGLIFSNWNMIFDSDMNVYGKNYDQYIDFSFCIKNGVSWESPDVGKKFEIDKGQFFICHNDCFEEHICYEKGVDFEFINIKIPKKYFNGIVKENFEKDESKFIKFLMENFLKSEISPSMKRVLMELSTFKYKGAIASMFIEGKFMELMAICFNMIFEKRYNQGTKIILNKTNMEAIKEAKFIIDSQIPHSLSCEELSNLVHISLSKLCKGFKNMYGMPVHSYIIDQQLEIAASMLQQGMYNVGEVASLIGYSNMSHFSSSFRKKYGINPKEFQKSYLDNLE
ncbi:AraC family transcriptional regulator [Clostridium sporogenes]|uniref:AraC family transcriptional regulator n=1 Tax=Clostridium botulinum TaxID=1491 RepID=A0A6M0SYH1_CLOBO|nr:AraC family transcriptional regulator [Clostridium sporogenes]NFA60173.1 AraC family transcriptional regulator [Clostridium botulinum]NFI72852.1 helix-turn-helix transcriptional regulator [Clostridium sporogenes]NFL73159.1 helix-turn-helix transcriptional regulator [Clostridium sporogenes]NFM23374.1 helix-turn-helix transcriptional regulator [Clostridium sporogenes]NFP60265.1 helix-turn-helix transcriptional regulator [Clostridium sporogenes]